VTFDELIQLLCKFTLQAGLLVLIDLGDGAMEGPEVVRVVDLLLLDVGGDQTRPHLLVIPLHQVHFNHELNQKLLVVNDFGLPLFQEDLFIIGVHELAKVRAGQLSIMSEGDHKFMYLLTVNVLDLFLELCLPVVKTEL